MATVNIVQANVDGDIGGLGVSRFAFCNASAVPATVSDAAAAVNAVQNMVAAIKSLVPIDVGWTVNPLVQCWEAATGGLQQETASGVATAVEQGTATGSYTAGVGARVFWHTVTIVNRRLVRGAWFCVPLIGSAFGSNGQLDGSKVPTITAAVQGYVNALVSAALVPVVWHRPTKLNPSGGLAAPIVTANVPFNAASLRSRRQ